MRQVVAAFIAIAIASPAAGAPSDTPRDRVDPRVRTLEYDPDQVYRIVGVVRAATQILFAPDEIIQHVALGDASGWEAAPEGHVLFLKPTGPARPTNLIVTSRRGGESRHYAFELVVRSGAMGRATPDTYFQVRFRYPKAERDQMTAILDAETEALERQVVQLKLERGVLAGARNLAYGAQGAAELAPSEVSDNGRFTVLRFPGAQPLPALYAVGPDGGEALVPFDVRGEFVVVHAVVRELRLRRGRLVLCLTNQAFAPYGAATSSGTAAEDVERVARPATAP